MAGWCSLTSAAMILPPGPVPETSARSMPFSLAVSLANGEATTRSPEEALQNQKKNGTTRLETYGDLEGAELVEEVAAGVLEAWGALDDELAGAAGVAASGE